MAEFLVGTIVIIGAATVIIGLLLLPHLGRKLQFPQNGELKRRIFRR